MAALNKTVALISGANQGIGLATAKRLAQEHNYHVIIGSRNFENGHKVADQLKSEGLSADTVQLDIQSDDSIAAATAYLTETYGHIDVLINNAGVLLDRANLPIRQLYDTTFSINVAGTACLTESLLPLLRKSAQQPRVVFVSTCMASLNISLDSSTPFYNIDYKAYDASKAAVNMLMINYSRILNDKKARVNAVCPGLVSTNLTGYMVQGTTAEVGAQRLVELATVTGENSDVTGTFSNRDGSLPW
ncbi:short chain dehydrogenase [Stipitochalara longipes BDJ]|nr:short chain dehydrogenase [Stipitochalara longipes BDJ]